MHIIECCLTIATLKVVAARKHDPAVLSNSSSLRWYTQFNKTVNDINAFAHGQTDIERYRYTRLTTGSTHTDQGKRTLLM